MDSSTIPVIWSERLDWDGVDVGVPSLKKGDEVRRIVCQRESASYNHLVGCTPLTMFSRMGVHDYSWLKSVEREPEKHCGFGFDGSGYTREEASPIVSRALYASQAMLQAAWTALDRGIAFAPVSGFHHAGYDWNGGFCTFNGLMYTAACMIKMGFVTKVLILDLDTHQGDGCLDIMKKLGVGDRLTYVGHEGPMGPGLPHDSENMMRDLVTRIWNLVKDVDLVLYQAGVDSHERDPIGPGYLTTDQLIVRDELVFNTCKQLGVPCAWNLAGGYQDMEQTVRLHVNTYLAAERIYCKD